MNKNIKLYSSEEVESNNALQLQKPKFDKPSFEKPVIKKIVSGKTKEEFDITKDMTQEEIDKMPQITLTIKHLKNFYDGLINSINKYDKNMDSAIQSGIITQLSSTIDSIGSKTSSIDSELADLRNSIPDIGEAPPLLHITGEENGLL
ncbi:hypothetical protein [Wolbachia endosymbiont (group A) of Lasioglossum morio]|uniref:hypothetical protein n=1 Tax=Wolbachia endosymbiont (group A) of Lasioglossum morio TaxID=2954025 RepID=UPI0022269DA0|nr:hypothetical protein [Wolbachia endosymbiont (group A) of Lasioglossum morio]